jgi:hypothetical protein
MPLNLHRTPPRLTVGANRHLPPAALTITPPVLQGEGNIPSLADKAMGAPASSSGPRPATPPAHEAAAPSAGGSLHSDAGVGAAFNAARVRASEAGEALAQAAASADQSTTTAARDAAGGVAAAAGAAARGAGDAIAQPAEAARGLVDSVREGLKVGMAGLGYVGLCACWDDGGAATRACARGHMP